MNILIVLVNLLCRLNFCLVVIVGIPNNCGRYLLKKRKLQLFKHEFSLLRLVLYIYYIYYNSGKAKIDSF